MRKVTERRRAVYGLSSLSKIKAIETWHDERSQLYHDDSKLYAENYVERLLGHSWNETLSYNR